MSDTTITTTTLWERELNLPLLTPEQELMLASRSRSGDQRATQQLFDHNVRLAVSTARRCKTPSDDLDVLMQVAAECLYDCAKRYDPALGWRFATYAVPSMENRIKRNRIVEMARGGFSFDHATRSRQVRHLPESEQAGALAKLTNLSSQDAQVLLDSTSALSLEYYMGDSLQLIDLISGDVDAMDEAVELDEHRQRLRDALRHLPATERQVIALRYGLATTHDHTIDEAARVLGLTERAVRTLERQAMDRLQGRRSMPRRRAAAYALVTS